MNKANVMNKPILTLLFLLSCLPLALAGPVTPEQAQRVAESFFATQPRTRASGADRVKLAWRLSDKETKADLLYAFDNGAAGGYVIVAGEDAASPVLGFSLSGSFPAQDMPEAMRDLLEYYGNVLRTARERNWVAAQSGVSFNPNTIVRLETAHWSQGDPYNRYCPVINGTRCVTGCVATAIGIIMNYHRWPERGTGDLPSYSYDYEGVSNTVEGHSLGHRYDWEAMNKTDGQDYDQIARLLYDVGVMVEMSYTPNASGAGSSYVMRLSQYFSYDKDIRAYERGVCSDERWEQLIRDEIDAGRPVYFSGFNSMGGHAMVIDGYSGRYFGINFGWGGGYGYKTGYSNPNQDGHWFLMTPIDGHERDIASYNRGQDIYCNIKPDEGGEPGGISSAQVAGTLGLPYDFAVGQEFSLTQWFHTDMEIQCQYALLGQDGRLKERISDVFTVPANGGWSGKPVPCVIRNAPQKGDRIEVVFEHDGKQWTLQHNRFGEFRFQDGSPRDEVIIGFVTENEANTAGSFMENALRAGLGIVSNMSDYLYFRCYKDYVWELLKTEAPFTLTCWASSDGSTNWGDYFVTGGPDRYSCMSLLREDICYQLIHLDPGEYILRVKNPLTGESVTINLTI